VEYYNKHENRALVLIILAYAIPWIMMMLFMHFQYDCTWGRSVLWGSLVSAGTGLGIFILAM